MKITIDGRPSSKKNNKRIFRSRHARGFTVLPSKAYNRFHAEAIPQILGQVRGRIKGPIHIDIQFHFKGKMTMDIDNAMTSLFDVLQDSGIIEDDKQIDSANIKRVLRNQPYWRTEITIEKY